MEFVWKGEGFGTKNGIFMHILLHHYFAPEFFFIDDRNRCFHDVAIRDDEIVRWYYLCSANVLKKLITDTLLNFRTNNLLLLWGGDFVYQNTERSLTYFNSIEKIMNAVEGVNVKFATPSEYFDAVFRDLKVFALFEGDLLPYVSPESPYMRSWTGFFFNKATIKEVYIQNRKVC